MELIQEYRILFISLLVKEKELQLSHEMTSTKKPLFNCAIKE
jgi:hypothetical protein